MVMIRDMTLGEMREEAGLTVDQVAVGLGLSPRHTIRLLSGQMPMKRAYIVTLAHLFGQPVAAVERAATGGKGEGK